MRKTFKLLMVFFIIIMYGMTNKVDAATVNFNANNSTVNVGDEITVTANITAAQWDLKIKLNGSVLAQSSELDNFESNITKSITAKYKPTEKGTLEFVLEGDITDVSQENKKINEKIKVTVNEKVTQPPSTGNESNNNTQTQPPATTQTPTKSSEARLKNLGIKPNDFSGFKRDKTEYTTEVPNNVSEVEVYATALDSKATVKGTGKVSLKEGDNTVKVTVTAEDGKATKTYTLTIKRKTASEEETESGEARLSQLGIKPEKYDFSGFKSDQTEYATEVPNDVEEIEVYAKAKDSKAQITGTGMIQLKEGKNELKIEVIAQNGAKQTYTLNVTRKEAEKEVVIEEKFGLSKLSIEGLSLTPSFMTGTYEYTVELTENLSSLEIEAKATDKDATVEIVGNDNLQEGENTITILVRNEDKEESATYQITVNKNLQKEEVIQASWLKPSTWGKEEKIKIAIIIVLIILIISAIILKIKMGKENKTQSKLDFPGADELDKAIIEHQELAGEEEINSNPEDISKSEFQEETIEQNEVQPNHMEESTNNEVQQNYIEEIARNRFAIEDDFEKKSKKRKGKH